MQTSLTFIPWWIYPIFFFLLFWGFRLCNECTVKVNRLLVLPILFVLITFHHFLKLSNISLLNVGGMLIGLGFGSYLGYLYKRDTPIKISRRKGLIALPGDQKIIFFILLSFVVEFSMVALETSPISWWFHPACMLISGTITGTIIGRNATYYYRYLHETETL